MFDSFRSQSHSAAASMATINQVNITESLSLSPPPSFSLTQSLTHSLPHSLTLSLPPSFTHSHTHSYMYTPYSLPQPLHPSTTHFTLYMYMHTTVYCMHMYCTCTCVYLYRLAQCVPLRAEWRISLPPEPLMNTSTTASECHLLHHMISCTLCYFHFQL